eukprot:10485035-Karenia_brevis.AAC.1
MLSVLQAFSAEDENEALSSERDEREAALADISLSDVQQQISAIEGAMTEIGSNSGGTFPTDTVMNLVDMVDDNVIKTSPVLA